MKLISVGWKTSACALVVSVLFFATGYTAVADDGPSSVAAGESETIDFDGDLEPGDAALNSNEFFDEHWFDAEADQAIVVDMRSTEFDPYLILQSPSGESWENDDWQDDRNLSRILVTADADGRWRILATSYEEGETGSYSGQIRVLADAAAVADSSVAGGSVDFLGRLGSGDPTLGDTGEYYAEHTFWADAGQTLTVEMRSSDFDPYIILKSPSGDSWHNDDWEDDQSLSRVDVVADASGSWRLLATTYEPGEMGSYRAQVRMSESPVISHAGTLGPDDEQLASGEWRDTYVIDGRQGEYVVINMTSSDVDTYLIVTSPGGEQWENDDHEGDETRSQIAMELPADGRYEVIATSYEPGEAGDYNLSIRRVTEPSSVASSDDDVIRGELAEGDAVLAGEEYIDRYPVEGRPGETLKVELRSTDFDTYLVIRTPAGQQLENDDFEDQTSRSFLEVNITEAGSYVVGVTSYDPRETGAYELEIAHVSGAPIASAQQQDTARVQADTLITGRLERDDGVLPSGEYHDLYTFDVAAGQSLKIDLTSSDFDTVLGVALPTGEWLQNDDFESRRDLSRVELTAEHGGRLRLMATSYDTGETGAYELTVTVESGPTVVQGVVEQHVRGVFVGISDYPDDGADLDDTAEDARRAHAAMQAGTGMREEDGVLLLDEQATRAAVEEAVQRIGSDCQPGDLFVFFFSGHGSRVDVPAERRDEWQDPDQKDETLCFHDEQMIDNDLADLLSVIDEDATVLVVLDSCFSGGFSKDVICKPGYMGLFSSHEDVTSAVAGKFQAGGYLAHFFANAVENRLADTRPADQMITALELCQYINEEYREHVREPGAKADLDTVTTSRDLGYQQFISDRGGIGPYHVLFAW